MRVLKSHPLLKFHKLLLKYILISAIIKLIFFIIVTTLSYFNLETIYLYRLIWTLLFFSFYTSKNKREYIITMIILAGFWYTLGNIFSLNELESLPFFSLFALNYQEAFCDFGPSFTNDYLNKVINYPNAIENFNCICEDLKLSSYHIEIKGYDPSASLYFFSSETSQINLDSNLERIHYIEKIRSQGQILNIKDLSGFILSKADLLDMVKDNLIKYEAEAIKFNNTINNIENGSELFYDPKSKILFLQYLNELIPCLLENNRSSLFNMLSDILSNLSNIPEETQGQLESFLLAQIVPLPEQTELEIESLSPQSVPLPEQTEEEIESLSPQSVPLPEQTEEEINSLINYLEVEEINSLEVEDIMEDAINNLGMFSEKD